MDLTTFSDQLRRRLVEFCWEEWAQMGVLGQTTRVSAWSTDPEALIVFTLEVARSDPRLFDEVLAWTLLNQGLLSVRRLRAMCADETDHALVDAAIGWLAREQPRARLKSASLNAREELVPLFHGGGPTIEPDPSFAAAGFERPPLVASGKSRAPDLTAPINLGLRLRAILGVGIRAEVIRVMLGMQAPRITAQALAHITRYSKRNVHDSLTGLTAAEVLGAFTVNGERRYAINKDIWAALLQCATEALPRHLDWAQLFSTLRTILRWSEQPTSAASSDYLLASGARQLLDHLRPDLAFVGIGQRSVTVDKAAEELATVTGSLLSALGVVPLPPL